MTALRPPRWTVAATAAVVAFVVGALVDHLAFPRAEAERRSAPRTAAAEPAPASSSVLNAPAGIDPSFVRTVVAAQAKVPELVPVTGKLALDKRELRIASARVAGRIARIFVFEGQTVKQGEPLAEIFSPEYVSAENELILARRFQQTLSQGQADADVASDALATYRAAEDRLRMLGASEADITALESSGRARELLLLRAPVNGVVVQRNVDPGGYLNVGDPLMSLASVDPLWLFVNVYEPDYARLRLGEKLEFSASALPGRAFEGQVAFVGPTLDPASHTITARCDIPNPGHALKPEMFITGSLVTAEQEAWVVPKSAVVAVRDTDYVFLRTSERQFRRVRVIGHPLDAQRYAILHGVDAAVPVVSDGAILINQLLGAD